MSRSIDKVARVTGASKGIGSGIATALASAGGRVAVNFPSDRQGPNWVAQAIINSGGEAITIGAEVSKATDVARLFKEVDAAFGRLDVLVNNAGVFRFGPFTGITEESFHVHYTVKVLGAILTVQQAIKRVRCRGRERYRHKLHRRLTSHGGSPAVRIHEGSHRNADKGLALELAPRKIRVKVIAPGHTETERPYHRGDL